MEIQESSRCVGNLGIPWCTGFYKKFQDKPKYLRKRASVLAACHTVGERSGDQLGGCGIPARFLARLSWWDGPGDSRPMLRMGKTPKITISIWES